MFREYIEFGQGLPRLEFQFPSGELALLRATTLSWEVCTTPRIVDPLLPTFKNPRHWLIFSPPFDWFSLYVHFPEPENRSQNDLETAQIMAPSRVLDINRDQCLISGRDAI